MPEQYVRPPLVAAEAPSTSRARLRFRVLGIILLAVLTATVVLIFLKVSNVTSEDPGLPFGLKQAVQQELTAR